MTVTLTYTVPDEEENLKAAIDAMTWVDSVRELDNQLRNWLKHGHEFENATSAIEDCRRSLHDILDENGLSLYP